MEFLSYSQVFVLLMVCLLVQSSPVSENPVKESNNPVFITNEKPDFPIADMIEEDKNIKTHVIGRMEDLEVTTWVSDLSELSFTIPSPMAESPELEDSAN